LFLSKNCNFSLLKVIFEFLFTIYGTPIIVNHKTNVLNKAMLLPSVTERTKYAIKKPELYRCDIFIH
jgi:hypothetical protein